MAILATINGSAALGAEFQAAIVDAFGYSATLPNGQANPETAAAFADRMLKQGILGTWLRDYRTRKARAAADAAVTDPGFT